MKDNNFKSNLFRQYNVKGIGSFINVFYMSLPIFGVLTNIMEAGTFYGVQKTNIHHIASWMSFPIFLGIVIVLGLFVILFFFKFVYPSYYAFLNRQSYIHQNPMQKDLEELKINQKEIMKHLGIEDKK
jgi:hypothetical protein